jgi:tetratricopeptide (TPR) repeat protein
LGSAVLTLAYVLQEMGDLNDASANLTRALELLRGRPAEDANDEQTPTDLPVGMEPLTLLRVAEGRRRQGDLLLRLGRMDEASAEYQAGLELARATSTVTDDLSLLFRLGYVAARLGDTKNATEQLAVCTDLLRKAGVRTPSWWLRTEQYARLIELAGPSEEVEQILLRLG